RRRRQRGQYRLTQVRQWLNAPASNAPTRRTPPIALATPQAPLPSALGVTTNFTKDAYLAAVRRAIEYINAGNCLQDNIAQELLHSAKDRAENVMIVDLLRNDLGRVCDYGSVRVEAVCGLETYRTVHHLVSEVRGRLRDGLGPVDLLRAAFPGGSVTGAPKVRAMEIIAELEPTSRGPYCGCLGYIGLDGSMDTNP